MKIEKGEMERRGLRTRRQVMSSAVSGALGLTVVAFPLKATAEDAVPSTSVFRSPEEGKTILKSTIGSMLADHPIRPHLGAGSSVLSIQITEPSAEVTLRLDESKAPIVDSGTDKIAAQIEAAAVMSSSTFHALALNRISLERTLANRELRMIGDKTLLSPLLLLLNLDSSYYERSLTRAKRQDLLSDTGTE